MALLGILCEAAATNLCLQSNAFTTTWTDIGSPTVTQNVVGPDGATSAWTFTDDNAAVNECKVQDVTLTAATWTSSVFVGKTVGVQSSYPILYSFSTVSSRIAICTVDTSNGVATAWTAYTGLTIAAGLVARCMSFNDDFWRVELTYTGTATAWQHALIPAGTANATQSTGTPAVATVGSAVFYGAQVELGSAATSYIPTTTAAVTRNADVLTYPSAGNISKALGWFSCEASSGVTGASAQSDLLTDSSTFALYVRNDVGGKLRFYNGIDDVNISAASSLSLPYSSKKIAATWNNPVTASGSVDGAAAVTTALTGAGPAIGANLRIGGGIGTPLGGTIRNVRIGQRQLSSSELQSITR